MADGRDEEKKAGEQEPQGAVGGEGMWSHVRFTVKLSGPFHENKQNFTFTWFQVTSHFLIDFGRTGAVLKFLSSPTCFLLP